MCPNCVNTLSFQAQTRAYLTWSSSNMFSKDTGTSSTVVSPYASNPNEPHYLLADDTAALGCIYPLCRASPLCGPGPGAGEPQPSSGTARDAGFTYWAATSCGTCPVWLKIFKYFLRYSSWTSSLEAQKLCYGLFNTTILASLHCLPSAWSLLCQTWTQFRENYRN